MTKYANRTCHHCGARRPQPEMRKEITYVESGRSRAGVSTRTGLGFLLGEKKSTNSVVRWMFNTNQRTYQRKKEVWVCSYGCHTVGRATSKLSTAVGTIIGYVFIISFGALIVAGIFSP